VDDAGGGRRGTRATVSAELWEVLAAGWAIPRQRGRDLGGSLNLNLLVSRGDERLVVRAHRPSVSPARLEAIQHARQQLDAAGVPCSALVVARDGARWARAAGRLVEVERYIPHDGRMHTPPRLARGLPLLGRVHALLAGAEVSPAGRSVEFANHIEPGAVLSGTRAGTARIRGWHPPPDERRMASQAERLAELVAAGEAGLVAGLPRQLVHGDFWDDNVFFQGETLSACPIFTSASPPGTLGLTGYPLRRRPAKAAVGRPFDYGHLDSERHLERNGAHGALTGTDAELAVVEVGNPGDAVKVRAVGLAVRADKGSVVIRVVGD